MEKDDGSNPGMIALMVRVKPEYFTLFWDKPKGDTLCRRFT
jgi:hypothetical protein